MRAVLMETLVSLQLQSNLIPGLNLNALGLFPSGAPGMGPSMSSLPPPGAHGGSSFGVSDRLLVVNSTAVCPIYTSQTWHWLHFNLLGRESGTHLFKNRRLVFSSSPHVSFFPLVQSLWG